MQSLMTCRQIRIIILRVECFQEAAFSDQRVDGGTATRELRWMQEAWIQMWTLRIPARPEASP